MLIDLYRGAASSLLNRDNVAQLLVLDPILPAEQPAASQKHVCRDLSSLVPNVPAKAADKPERAWHEKAPELRALGVDVQSKTAGAQSICLVNTHLLFNPRRRDVRLAQISMLLAEAERASRIPPDSAAAPAVAEDAAAASAPKQNPSTCDRAPIFMCGDFNLEPGWPEHRFIMEGRVELLTGYGWRTISPRGFPLLALGIGVDSVFAPPAQSTAPHSDDVDLIPLTITSLDDPPPLLPERLDRHSSPDRHLRGSRSPSPGRRGPHDAGIAIPPAPHLSHVLQLKSAYEVRGPALEGPAAAAAKFLRVQAQELTSFHTRGFNMVDYILYSQFDQRPQSARRAAAGEEAGAQARSPWLAGAEQRRGEQTCVHVKALLLSENLTALPGLPSRAHPSDHVPLATRFQLDF